MDFLQWGQQGNPLTEQVLGGNPPGLPVHETTCLAMLVL